MPSHQERREPLPKGYQFPTPEHIHEMAAFDPMGYQGVCRCGARFDAEIPGEHWYDPNDLPRGAFMED